MRATDKVIQKNSNTEKTSKIGYTITKWRPRFLSRNIKFPTTFPKEIWLKIEDCKYNYTAEKKMKIVIRLRLYGKNKF